MMVRIYHNPRCSKSRQTLALIEEQGITPDVIQYLDTPPTPQELNEILGMLGMAPEDILRKKEAKEEGLNYEAATFPWAASGRAIASARTEGKTKMIFEKETGRVLGGAIVGINAGEMLGEICLAVEMGAEAEDVGLTIHAHPTLNESIGLAAEIFEGSITDLPNAKAVKKKK